MAVLLQRGAAALWDGDGGQDSDGEAARIRIRSTGWARLLPGYSQWHPVLSDLETNSRKAQDTRHCTPLPSASKQFCISSFFSPLEGYFSVKAEATIAMQEETSSQSRPVDNRKTINHTSHQVGILFDEICPPPIKSNGRSLCFLQFGLFLVTLSEEMVLSPQRGLYCNHTKQAYSHLGFQPRDHV